MYQHAKERCQTLFPLNDIAKVRIIEMLVNCFPKAKITFPGILGKHHKKMGKPFLTFPLYLIILRISVFIFILHLFVKRRC